MGTDMLIVRAGRLKTLPVKGLCVVLWLGTISEPARAAAPPIDSSAHWPIAIVVAEHVQLLRINGLDVRSRALTSALAPDAACALLERQWRAAEAPVLVDSCQRAGSWYVITHPSGDVVETAQFKALAHGSGGFVSTVDPLAVPAGKPRVRLPLPAGTRVLNIVQSIESGNSVTQFTLLLPLPLTAALMKLRTTARERGWESVQARDSSVIDFQRGAVSSRAIAASAPMGTAIVLVEHDASGLPR